MIDKPNYVLETHEGVWKPKKDPSGWIRLLKISVWILFVIAVIRFIFLQIAPSVVTVCLLIMDFIVLIAIGKDKEFIPSTIEMWFYDQYLVVYREKRYYDSKVLRKEYNKFFYSDISRIDYSSRLKRLNIVGKVDAAWFNYNKDGTVPNVPTYHKTVDGGICYFYVYGNDSDNIISQLEKFSGKQVSFRDN